MEILALKKFADLLTDKQIKILGRIYIVFLAITPFLLTLIIELSYGNDIFSIRLLPLIAELLSLTMIEFIAIGFLPFYSIGLILCYVLTILFAMANFYCIKFRGIPLMLMDLLEVSTAFEVSNSYDFRLSFEEMTGIFIFLGAMAFILLINPFVKKYFQKKFSYIKSLILGGSSILVFTLALFFISFSGDLGIVMNMWQPILTYEENGALSSFICYAQFSVIKKPKGYSKEEVIRVLREAEQKYDSTHVSLENNINPTIISIMNESFSDLSVLGPLECTKNHLAFYNSLKEDPGTIWHGYHYVSTYGGGTARSEYEWLTGYSMRMYPSALPYSQFNFTNIATCVDALSLSGYTAVAMHPENPNNYRRNTVYSQMGFDKFLSKDDFAGYEKLDILRKRYSDWGDYSRLIKEFETIETNKFFHNVTMQNHGGFDFYIRPEHTVSVDKEYRGESELICYETLLAGSDRAVERLINYFKNVKEPVIICMYGDHLPGMPVEFTQKLMEKGYDESLNQVENEERKYKVPFFIWANYELEDYVKEYKRNGELITSTNYLGVVTRANAGEKLSAFDKYLLLLREKIPVINEHGYVAGGRWYGRDDKSDYEHLLNEYECIQYAGMFDLDNIEYLFGGQNGK